MQITSIPGIKVGHAQKIKGLTGCTVILSEKGAVGGVDVRGSAPATREIELLRPIYHIQKVHAILLTGGSAYGLDAAGGVMKYLEEKGIGYHTRVAKVPIVPTAAIFDLAIGNSRIRPDTQLAYQACQNASDKKVEEGRVGAGIGATVGKLDGKTFQLFGGIGTSAMKIGAVHVGALVVVNALGNVLDENQKRFISKPIRFSKSREKRLSHNWGDFFLQNPFNTTLAVVATDARLSKEETNKFAMLAQNGLARSVYPVHTMYDGDIVFGLSTGERKGDVNVLGTLAADLVAESIRRAVRISNNL
jgi:L-aminopeptidase/D-esterase-like protein